MEKQVRVTTRAISLNTSGIVGISVPLRNAKDATANYSPAGVAVASGNPVDVQVVKTSGGTVNVQFLVTSGVAQSGIQLPTISAPAGSGVGFSGGTLTVVAYGD